MFLRYMDSNGKVIHRELGTQQTVIGRSEEAEVQIKDEDASRFHAAIILWDGDYIVKDLNTSNGTLINGKGLDVAVLTPGSVIHIGSHNIFFETEKTEAGKGPSTVIQKVSGEMDQGKGYKTIMREIIRDVEIKEETKVTNQHSPEN
ncbi:FHA domain-containing protein [Verrucomicrobiota bacterium]